MPSSFGCLRRREPTGTGFEKGTLTARLDVDVPDLVSRVRAGQAHAVARAISLIEAGHGCVRSLMGQVATEQSSAHVVGVTGPPGVGKSTTTNGLVRALRAAERTVGVLAVDPSSPFSGGALLGDRLRMEEHATDPGVFLRSMAARGHLGGLAAVTSHAVRILEAAGCEIVVVETVGVGQSEVDVASLADTTVVVLAPGLGDGIQAAKAGVLEIGDVFVVNKVDREGAQATLRDVRHMLELRDRPLLADWPPPAVPVSALEGRGIDDLVAAIDAHAAWLTAHDRRAARRQVRVAAELLELALAHVRNEIMADRMLLDRVAGAVQAGELDPYAGADLLYRGLSLPGE